MIQDIAPHLYNNAFAARRAPRPADFVLPVRGGKLFLYRDVTEGEKSAIAALPVSEILRALAGLLPAPEPDADEQTEPRGRKRIDGEDGTYLRDGVPLIYLFAIDETAYYGLDEPELLDALEAAFPDAAWEASSVLRGARPRTLAFAGITAVQLARWRGDRRFCGACGARMRPSRTERAFVCTDCGEVVYPKISPAVIVAVTHGDRILLTKYAGRSYARYALIAGFTEIGETIEETVHREVWEEVGVKVKNLRFYKSQPWSFSDTLLMGFYCELDGDDEAITLDETELAVGVWMRRGDLPDRSDDISLTSEMMERFRLGQERE